jgi:phosphotransferase system  glucose/maltose/N-acetylglucosamine-specific IIC component
VGKIRPGATGLEDVLGGAESRDAILGDHRILLPVGLHHMVTLFMQTALATNSRLTIARLDFAYPGCRFGHAGLLTNQADLPLAA